MPKNSNTDPKPQCVQTDVMCRFSSEYEKVSNNLCRPSVAVSMWKKSSRKKKYD
jgi:hypothetical protein